MLQERLKTQLCEEKRRLKHLYKVQSVLPNDEAALAVRMYSNGRKEYYIREQHGKKQRYAGAKEQARVEQLKLKRRVETEIGLRENNCKWLEELIKEYVDCDCDYEAVDTQLPMAYRGAFVPAVLAGPEMRKGSIGPAFTRSEMKKFRGETWYRTSFGLMVRSKSEVIIAEQLYGAGIPFHYEREKLLMTRKDEPEIVYPDFTIPLTGRILTDQILAGQILAGQILAGQENMQSPMLYWEHMGMMDREGYRNRAMEKMDWYVYSGILPGRDLILTMEADDGDLDSAALKRMIEGIILPQIMG